jgi:hypothetical protein
MRRQNKVAVDADVVVCVAVGQDIGRVDIVHGGAVVYYFNPLEPLLSFFLLGGEGKRHTWVAKKHNLADPRGSVGVELPNSIMHNLASLRVSGSDDLGVGARGVCLVNERGPVF